VLDSTNALKWAGLAAAVEAVATGVVLIITPQLFARLVFAAAFSSAGQALGRLAGIALIGLAIATWPSPMPANQPAAPVRALGQSQCRFRPYSGAEEFSRRRMTAQSCSTRAAKSGISLTL